MTLAPLVLALMLPLAPAAERKETLSDLQRLIGLVKKSGRDWKLFDDSRGPMFGFTEDGVPSKALAVSGTPTRMCSVVVDKEKPVCIVLLSSLDYENHRKNKDWYFRFDLNGSLEKAVSAVGETDEAGKGVQGSGKASVQDIQDPDIRDRARAELKFWLARAKTLMKEGTAKKTAAKPQAAAAADASALDKLH